MGLLLFTSCISKVLDQSGIKFHSDPKISRSTPWHLQKRIPDSTASIDFVDVGRFLKKIEPATVIVAVLDTPMEISHDSLKDHIWVNQDEIPGNQIDDDNNGYVDDINGWNYIANLNDDHNLYVNLESTRILKSIGVTRLNESIILPNYKDPIRAKYYQTVLAHYKERKANLLRLKKNYERLDRYYYGVMEEVQPYFNDREITLKAIDSLEKAKSADIDSLNFVALREFEKYNINSRYVDSLRNHYTQLHDLLTDLDYNDRQIQGDDANNLNDRTYGSPKINVHTDLLDHANPVAGIILGLNHGNSIKLMSLATSCYGDENDKDIALAIRYAVDNGAKVINMSFWKHFSLHQNWVHDAIKYAAEKDVLIISIAGNDGLNIQDFPKYPNDTDQNGREITDNFMLIGASNRYVNHEPLVDFSNYGKIDVDLFAPGIDIYTAGSNNTMIEDFDGTSAAAPIVSGVAALIRSYYPSLTAPEVKHILMESGVTYTVKVPTPTETDPEKTTPFNELSKSGKILNAHNAIKMADRLMSTRQ
ncbi:S8 family serine peptidase [Nonlabens xiamenensis]|uniref:S8 family serine peptidase n=1 Tax=Nonlabens xiamenensis TaxID=2341043 RepID=UPI0013DE5A66|nr:S8 family serine peptidase [Nonlabens xiamenensis]